MVKLLYSTLGTTLVDIHLDNSLKNMNSPQLITLAQLIKSEVLVSNIIHLKDIMYLEWGNFNLLESSLARTSFYIVILGIKGRRKIEVEGHQFVIKPYTISIIPAQSLLCVASAEEEFEAQVLFFNEVVLKGSWMQNTVLEDLMFINPDYPPTFPLQNIKSDEFKYRIQKIAQEIKDNVAFGLDMIRLYLLQILYDYNRICEVCLLNSDSSINRKFQIMHQFRQLVDKQFKEHKKVSFYADQLFITPKYLSECVVDQLGYPASNLIYNRILQEASYLLRFSNKSIKEIAFELKFDSSTHFSRFFTLHEGIRPLKFRMESKGF